MQWMLACMKEYTPTSWGGEIVELKESQQIMDVDKSSEENQILVTKYG